MARLEMAGPWLSKFSQTTKAGERKVNTEDAVEMALEEEGAETIWVRKNEDGDLEIDNLTFNKDEITQLRNFLNENFGD